MNLMRTYVRHVRVGPGRATLARKVLNADLRDHPREVETVTRFGARMRLDTRDLIQRYVYLFGIWEPHLTRWVAGSLRPGDTFVDVGANVGYFSLLAASRVGVTGHVVAVEASAAVHRRLIEHRDLNGYGAIVRAVNAAVSDKRETLRFVLASSQNIGANSIVPYDGPAESSFEMTAQPLGELLRADELRSARVIKVDVEGAEGAVVRGLAGLLDQLRPDAEVAIEVSPERMAALGDDAGDLMDTFRRHGFHPYRLPNSYDPGDYPQAIRRPVVPMRWHGPVIEESELVFSRVDAERLG
ncbi:FkbM family methyltransferase [Streptomyces sp. NPDC088732]|uniref:FkbM family methyltransferase n=1 Tax=Streptomyces sp. NPDC088732 TaxID=3365879 RepID=UPI0037FF033A